MTPRRILASAVLLAIGFGLLILDHGSEPLSPASTGPSASGAATIPVVALLVLSLGVAVLVGGPKTQEF